MVDWVYMMHAETFHLNKKRPIQDWSCLRADKQRTEFGKGYHTLVLCAKCVCIYLSK